MVPGPVRRLMLSLLTAAPLFRRENRRMVLTEQGALFRQHAALAMQALDEGHLLCISVAPAHQGQGHGQRLLHALQDWAQRQGIASLWLEVRASNARAQALYTRHGFEAVGQRKNYYPCGAGAREAAIVMCQTL